jgi:hypothetical protein
MAILISRRALAATDARDRFCGNMGILLAQDKVDHMSKGDSQPATNLPPVDYSKDVTKHLLNLGQSQPLTDYIAVLLAYLDRGQRCLFSHFNSI